MNNEARSSDNFLMAMLIGIGIGRSFTFLVAQRDVSPQDREVCTAEIFQANSWLHSGNKNDYTRNGYNKGFL